MKQIKRTFSLLVLITVLVDLAIALPVLLLTPEDLRSTPNFWLGWIFAAVVGVLAWIGILFYANSDKATRLLALRSLGGRGCAIFQALYILVFVIAAYGLQDSATALTVLLEAAITIAYLLWFLLRILGIDFLRQTNAQQERIIEQKKSTYIPSLAGQLEIAIQACTDPTVKKQLIDLCAAVNASPAISVPQAEMTERALKALIYQINQYVQLHEYADIPDLVIKANAKLSERNLQCR